MHGPSGCQPTVPVSSRGQLWNPRMASGVGSSNTPVVEHRGRAGQRFLGGLEDEHHAAGAASARTLGQHVRHTERDGRVHVVAARVHLARHPRRERHAARLLIGSASMSARTPRSAPASLPSISATTPVPPTPARNGMPSCDRNSATRAPSRAPRTRARDARGSAAAARSAPGSMLRDDGIYFRIRHVTRYPSLDTRHPTLAHCGLIPSVRIIVW